MINCKNCGGLNQEGSQVCGSCGASLVDSQVNNNETPSNNLDTNAQSHNNIFNEQHEQQNNYQENNTQQNPNINQEVYVNNNFNKNAIFSIICSLISFFVFWWLAFAGISCGVAALKQIKDEGGKGKILAILGIVLSLVDLILYVIGQIAQM